MKNKLFILTMLGIMPYVFSMEQTSLDEKIFVAARDGDLATLRTLLSQEGADVNARGNYGAPALEIAIENEHIDVVRFLLEHGANVHAEIPEDELPLASAAHRGNFEIVQMLLAYDADVNELSDREFQTPLIEAVINGHFNIVQLLMEHGADVNIEGGLDFTPLMAAAENGEDEIAKLLLEHGADIDTVDAEHNTAIDYAARVPNDHVNLVLNLLTTISNQNAQRIRNDIRGMIGVRFAQPQLPKDVRRFITSQLIDTYVEERMGKIRKLLERPAGPDLHQLALDNHNQRVAELLNLDNPVSVERIRRAISNNIKRILFGEPVRRERTIENNWQEALGKWFEEDNDIQE